MRRKKTIDNYVNFEAGALYELQKSRKKKKHDFSVMRFSGVAGAAEDINVGDIVLCLGRSFDCQRGLMATDFLLPNGTIGTISIFNFIPVGFFGLKLVKVKARNKRKDSSNA